MSVERVRLRDLIARRQEEELGQEIGQLAGRIAGVRHGIETNLAELRSLARKLDVEPEIRRCPEEVSNWRPGDALEVVRGDGSSTTVETSILPLLRGLLLDAASEVEEALCALDPRVWQESFQESLLDDLGSLPDEEVPNLLEAVTQAPAGRPPLELASFRESDGLRASFAFTLPPELCRALETLTSFLYRESETVLEIEEGGYFAAELAAHLSDLVHTSSRLASLGEGAEIGRKDVALVSAAHEASRKLAGVLTSLQEVLGSAR